MKKAHYLYGIIALYVISCTSTMNKETTLYCDCLKEVYGKEGNMKQLQRCFDIHDSLKHQYVEDPKYWKELNSKMKSCADNWVE